MGNEPTVAGDRRPTTSLHIQVRELLRGIAKLSVDGQSQPEKRRRLLDYIIRLLKPDSWACWTASFDADRRHVAPLALYPPGASPAAAMAALEATCNAPWRWEQLYDALREDTVLTRVLLPPDGAGIELASAMLNDGGDTLSFMGFFRRDPSQVFTSTQVHLLELAGSDIPWLHRDAMPQAGIGRFARDLPASVQRTIPLLLEGLSRQDIADRLSLSQHTINGYVKDIYAAFGVNSQPELMVLFLRGDLG